MLLEPRARTFVATVLVTLRVQELLASRLNPVDPAIGWTTDTDPDGW